MSHNIEHIIRRAQRGESQAIAELYELHVGQIFRYVSYRVATTSDAEDITSEVFVNMVKGLGNYEYRGAPFEAWLYRIASARIVDFRRRSNRNQQIALQEEMHDDRPEIENRLIETQEFEALRDAIGQLSEDYQTVLVLRFIERKSHIEVAEIMNKTEAAVKTLQHRALTLLSKLLGLDEKARHYLRGTNNETTI